MKIISSKIPFQKIVSNKKLFLIIFLCLLHGYNLFEPPLEVQPLSQTWRAQIARNLSKNGFNLILPEIDSTGSLPGYVRSEFQIYTLLVSIFDHFWGHRIFWGRLISLLSYIASIFFLYKLINKIENKLVAFYSIIIYLLFPINFIFNQTFLPDPTMNSLSILSLYSFMICVQKGPIDIKWHTIFFISFTCTLLIKIYMLFLLVPFIFYLYLNRKDNNSHNKIYILIVISILINLIWYIYAEYIGHKYCQTSFGSPLYWFNYKLLLSSEYYITMFKRFTLLIFTPIGFALFILSFLQKKFQLSSFINVWFISYIIFFIVTLNGNYTNTYYQLTITPILSYYIAIGYLSITPLINNKLYQKIILFLLIFILIFIPIIPHFKIPKFKKEMVKSAIQFSKYIPVNTYIITAHGTQTFLYFFDRKGWDLPVENQVIDENNFNNIVKYKKLGAKFLILESHKQLDQFCLFAHENSFNYDIINNISNFFLIKL